MKSYIGKVGSLGKYNDIERLENRPDFLKMINIKTINGMHDYVNLTAASTPKWRACPSSSKNTSSGGEPKVMCP